MDDKDWNYFNPLDEVMGISASSTLSLGISTISDFNPLDEVMGISAATKIPKNALFQT